MNLNNKNFAEVLEKLIKFRTNTSTIPISNTSWEELIWAALVFIYGDEKAVEWDSQSHEKSVDIKVVIRGSFLKISAKGGVLKNGRFSLSSYRLTTFKNLKDKLAFIKAQHEKFDFYLICLREIDLANKKLNYTVIKSPASKFAPFSMLNIKRWKKTKSGYELKSHADFEAKIVSKMSDQLWYSFPLNYFSDEEKIASISVPFEDMGKGLINFLKNSEAVVSLKKN